MTYIGPEPNPGQNREVDDISSSFNGSTTAFTLQVNSQNVSPGSSNNIIVSVGGVVQNPSTDYTVAASTITFTTAPASGLSFFGLVLGQQVDIQSLADGTSPTMSAPTITGDLSIADKIVHTGDTNTAIRFPAADTITAETGGSERLRVDSSGRFLIGTSTYKSNLNASADSSGQVAQFVHAGDNINGCLGVFAYSGSTSPTTRGAKLQLHRARSSDGSTNTTLSSGDLIGSLEFKGNDGTSFTAAARIDVMVDGGTGTDDMPGRMMFFTSADGSGAPSERMRISNDGKLESFGNRANNIGQLFQNISSTSPEGILIQFSQAAPNTASRHFLKCNDNVGDKMVIDTNGNLRNLNNSYGGFSDISLKENIVDAGSQWNDIKNVKVRVFNFKTDDASEKRIGVVAQEIETVCPKLVDEVFNKDDDGNLLETSKKSVKYSVLYMKAIKALQEAQARIETLETKVAALEAA